MPAPNQRSRGCWLGQSGPNCSFTYAVFAGHRKWRTAASRAVSSLHLTREKSKKRPQATVSTAVHPQVEAGRRSRGQHADKESNAIFPAVKKFRTQYKAGPAANELAAILDTGSTVWRAIAVCFLDAVAFERPEPLYD